MKLQFVLWKRLWPVFKIHKWKDPYHNQVGLKYSILLGPLEIRIWRKNDQF